MKAKIIKPYLFILPLILFSVLFCYYPFIRTFTHAFSRVNIRGEITAFAGFDNFTYLFGRREFSAALQNTLLLTLLNVPLTVLITLIPAWLCEQRSVLSPLHESMIALPMAVSMPAATLLFGILLNPTAGYINHALQLSLGWFQDKQTALLSVLLLNIWQGIGFNFLLFLSAFRAIPASITDAARIDGAGRVKTLLHVQLPQITPTLIFVICTNTVQCLMTAGPILILTNGGPSRATTTLIFMMYNSGYGSSNYSMAACIAIVTFLISLLFTAATLYAEERRHS